jgi:branched-chain amino acid transport system substrate-binding protein
VNRRKLGQYLTVFRFFKRIAINCNDYLSHLCAPLWLTWPCLNAVFDECSQAGPAPAGPYTGGIIGPLRLSLNRRRLRTAREEQKLDEILYNFALFPVKYALLDRHWIASRQFTTSTHIKGEVMKRILLVALAVLVASMGPAYGKQAVKIGLITPLTGDVKTYGESAKNAFLIALEEYAKKGKYEIVPVIADDKNDPTEGQNGALKMITQDKVVAFAGPLTSKVAIPVSEIATKHKVPMVTGTATADKVTVYEGKRKPYVFRACFIDPFQGKVAATFALKDLKAKTAAVLFDVGNDYSKGLAEVFKATFEKEKGTIVAFESYQKDDVDFSALTTKVAMKKPDLIFLPDYYNKVALIARQLRERAVKSILIGTDGWDSPELLKIGGSAIVGGYFTNHYSPERKDAVAERFIARYKEKHGITPDALGALTYDATMILLEALDKAKEPTGEEIVKGLSQLKGFHGVTGTISFDKNGDAVKSAVILKLDKDGAKYVTTVNP